MEAGKAILELDCLLSRFKGVFSRVEGLALLILED
jgi:hypothetical protein